MQNNAVFDLLVFGVLYELYLVDRLYCRHLETGKELTALVISRLHLMKRSYMLHWHVLQLSIISSALMSFDRVIL